MKTDASLDLNEELRVMIKMTTKVLGIVPLAGVMIFGLALRSAIAEFAPGTAGPVVPTGNYQGISAGYSGTAGYVAVGSSNSYINGIPALGSKNVLYATQWGAVPDSVVVPTGSNGAGLHVGTDDTLSLNLMYAYAHYHPGTQVVLDGAFAISGTLVTSSHPAALMVPPYTDTRGSNKSCGLILSASSNCCMISNWDITGNPAATFDQDISFENLTLNGNCGYAVGSNYAGSGTCAYQSRYELGSSSNGWVFGAWFSGVQDFYMKNVDFRNASTFCFVFGNYSGVTLDHCGAIWDWPDTTGTAGLNHDGYHIWGPGIGLKLLHCFDIGGDDDTIALNTNEGAQVYTSGSAAGYMAYQRNPWTTASNPAITGTWVTSDTLIEDFKSNAANNFRWYGYPLWSSPGVINGLKMIGMTGTSSNYPNVSNVVGYNGLITGWDVYEAGGGFAGSCVLNTGTAFGTLYSVGQLQMYGNAVSANNPQCNAPFIGTQYDALGATVTWSYNGGLDYLGALQNFKFDTTNNRSLINFDSYGDDYTQDQGLVWHTNVYTVPIYSLLYSGTTGIYGDLNLTAIGGANPTWTFDPSGTLFELSGTTRAGYMNLLSSGSNAGQLKFPGGATITGTAPALTFSSGINISNSGSGAITLSVSGTGSGSITFPGGQSIGYANPSALPGCVLDLDPNAISGTNGAILSSTTVWLDASGNGKNATVSGTGQWTLETNFINGNNVLLCGQSGPHFQAPISLSSTSYTAIVVSYVSGGQYPCLIQEGPLGSGYLGLGGGNAAPPYPLSVDRTQQANINSALYIPSTTFSVCSFSSSSAVTGGNASVNVFANGTEGPGMVSEAGITTGTCCVIGFNTNYTGTNTPVGYIGRILVFEPMLSASNQETIERTLMHQYYINGQ